MSYSAPKLSGMPFIGGPPEEAAGSCNDVVVFSAVVDLVRRAVRSQSVDISFT